jgi:hypothetical protein
MKKFYHLCRVTQENHLVEEMKRIMDTDANFAKPLSDFWKGCEPKDTMAYGLYGVWFSGEGGSMIDRDYAAYYYDKSLSEGHPKLQELIKEHDLELIWHDCGTPMLVIKGVNL